MANKEDMFAIKYSDKTLDSLDLVLSAIISNSDTALDMMHSLHVLVTKDECEGFYYIIMSLINRILTIKSATHDKGITLNEVNFKRYLNTHILQFLKDPEVNAKKMFEEVQVTMGNSNTDEGFLKEQRLLYSICMQKFRVLASNNISDSDVLMLLDGLYQNCITDYCINSVKYGSMVLNQGLTYHGVDYMGPEGYLDINRMTTSKILQKQSVWSGIENSVIVLDSVENYNAIMERSKFRMTPICKIGLPPIDNFATLSTSDIVNLTATEGTGKTTFCCALAAREIRAGFSVIYMCGETVESIIMNMVLSHFIYLETGYEISWKEISYIYSQLTQDILDNAGEGDKLDDFKGMPQEYYAIVNDCKYKMLTTAGYGKLIPYPAFSYNNFKQEVYDIIDANPTLKFGHIIIDHTDALIIDNTNRNLYIKDRHTGVGELFKQIVQVKRERGIPTFTTSHTSFDAEKLIQAGKETGTRVGATNSGTSKDVDIVITFESTPKLKSQGLIKVVVKKYRTVDDTLFTPFIVKKEFTACRFLYTAELQAILGTDSKKQIDVSSVGIMDTNAEDLIGD